MQKYNKKNKINMKKAEYLINFAEISNFDGNIFLY